MQLTNFLVLGFAAFVAADCDENDDNSNDCSTSSMMASSTSTTESSTMSTSTSMQSAMTSDVNLQSGYVYTTNSNNMTIATYTGSDPNAPSTTSIGNFPTGNPAGSMSGNDDEDGDDDDNNTTSDSFAMATAVPYVGAAAMAGAALFI